MYAKQAAFVPACFPSKMQAVSKIVDYAQEQGKSRRKSAAYVLYVSILRRLLTQLLSVRYIFEIACSQIQYTRFISSLINALTFASALSRP
jgi:hypothetical protein